jgi:hypothetical protein
MPYIFFLVEDGGIPSLKAVILLKIIKDNDSIISQENKIIRSFTIVKIDE